jgi:hypothetical protein
MSERFKVTKSEEPNTFPNYGATTGIDTDDSLGKMIPETDAKHAPSSLDETIGRREQKRKNICILNARFLKLALI